MLDEKYKSLIKKVSEIFGEEHIDLHKPLIRHQEKRLVKECLDSGFVSTVGDMVTQFEQLLCIITGAKYCVATINGTAGLHASLMSVGVKAGDEVLTQPLTFVATSNAITYCNAKPIYIDVNEQNLGLCPEDLQKWLNDNTVFKNNVTINKLTGARVSACLPVHTLGIAAGINDLKTVCKKYNIKLIEDAAEGLGTTIKGKHVGTFGDAGIISFNGNKIITTGAGGAVLTNNKKLFLKLRHLTTTAKIPHTYEYQHDQIGYNYRLANINAALGIAQLKQLNTFIKVKRNIHREYKKFCDEHKIEFIDSMKNCDSNCWLNAVLVQDKNVRKEFLEFCHTQGVYCRPIWKLIPEFPMYKDCQKTSLKVARDFARRLICIPSSVPSHFTINPEI